MGEIRGNKLQCTHCLEFKDFSYFCKNPALKSGLQSHCNPCRNKQQALRRADPANAWRFQAAHKKYASKRNKARREKHLSGMLYAARARAKRRGVPCTISASDIVIPERCPILGIELVRGADGHWGADRKIVDGSPSLDCIIPKLGYVIGNVQVISSLANTMKGKATPTQLVRFAHWVLTEFTAISNEQCGQSEAMAEGHIGQSCGTPEGFSRQTN